MIIAYVVFVPRFEYRSYFSTLWALSKNSLLNWDLENMEKDISQAYALIIMLSLKSSKPAALFRFKLLNSSSNSSKFNSETVFFHYDISKVLEIFFSSLVFFFRQF